MDMPKLLIASSSEEFSQSIAHAFKKQMQIQRCHDGHRALALLSAFRPDILLIDLTLPEIDGLTVLQAAADRQIHQKTIVVSDLRSPYIANALTRLQVSYMLMKPCDLQSVLGHISDLAACLDDTVAPAVAQPVTREAIAAQALLRLGMHHKWNGFFCLQQGIPRFADDPCQAVTKELYTDLGKPYGKNAKQIERNIRSAINKSWDKGDPAVWRQYFPAAPDGTVPRPSNKVFIAHMAQILYPETKEKVG